MGQVHDIRKIKEGKHLIYQHRQLIKYKSYSAEIGQENYDYHAGNKGSNLKIANDYDFVKYVEYKIIEDKYSLDAVIMELKKNRFCNPATGEKFKIKIQTKTLYNYIDQGIFLS